MNGHDRDGRVLSASAGASAVAGGGRRASDGLSPALREMLRASDGLLDLLPVATVICDAKGRILQYNHHAAAIWGRQPTPDETHEQFTAGCKFYSVDGAPMQRSLMAEVLRTGSPLRNHEVLIEKPDGSRVVCSVNIDPLKNAKGEMIGAVNCFLDITDRKRIDAALLRSQGELREQEQRHAATYEHASIGISETDAEGRFLRVNEAICAITGLTREQLLNIRLFRYTHEDDADPDRDAWEKQVTGELDFYSVEKRFRRPDGRVIWMSVRSSPVRDADGRFLYAVRVVQDVTERKMAEERQKLLVDELNHRVKNTLATVQSLAAQTARGAPTPALFRERFEGRLIALSKAHDQLTAQHWASADLRDILTAAFAPYVSPGSVRAIMRGGPVRLRPRAALTLAMSFHELITNAIKYGALSSLTGKIEIAWEKQRATADAPGLLRINWVETGGPPVVKPERRGFGSTLIEGGIASELGGKANLDYAADGVRCTIELPHDEATEETP